MTELGNNARILFEILKDKPHTVGAEVGVFEGDTSWRLLERLPSLETLFCVDIWQYDEDFYKACPNKKGRVATANWDNVYKKFKDNVVTKYTSRVIELRMPSSMASKRIVDGLLDFVFIDANHTYKHAKDDIHLWMPKVKLGGVIAGDDFVDKPMYGVKKAVKESFKNYEVINGKIWFTIKN